MLDMNDPDEVAAAAGKFADAIDDASEQVRATLAKLCEPRDPRSALDYALDHCARRWVVAPLSDTLAASAPHAQDTLHRVRHATAMLGAADLAGREHVRARSV